MNEQKIKPHYVYVYLNPFVKCDINIIGYNFKHKPYYIGKGMGLRYMDHLNTSLREINVNVYKENKIKHIFNLLNNDRNEFYKYVHIIEYFENEYDALLLEYNLIKLMGRKVKGSGYLTNISNHHPSGLCFTESMSIYDKVKLYDLKTNSILNIPNYIKWTNERNIPKYWMHNRKTLDGRYCLLHNALELKKDYKMYNVNIYKLYKNNHVIYVNYYQMRRLFRHVSFNTPSALIKGININGVAVDSMCGWYINKEKHDFHYNRSKIIIIIYKDDKVVTLKGMININKFCKENKIRNIDKVINGERISTNGWFIDKKENDKFYNFENTYIEFYKDKEVIICKLRELQQYKEKLNINSDDIYTIYTHLKKNIKTFTIKGWTTCKEENDYNYTLTIWYYINSKNEITERKSYMKDISKEIGRNAKQVVLGTRNHDNGFYFHKEKLVLKLQK